MMKRLVLLNACTNSGGTPACRNCSADNSTPANLTAGSLGTVDVVTPFGTGGTYGSGKRVGGRRRQQSLNFLPEPHGQGSLRPTRCCARIVPTGTGRGDESANASKRPNLRAAACLSRTLPLLDVST